MPTEFPLALFPPQLFPDVDLKSVTMTETALTISVTESEWAISEDMEYFFGPGDMIFQFSGEPAIGWKELHETTWHRSNHELLPHLVTLEIIRRQGNGSWLFQFSCREKELVAAIILDEVTRIDWTGEADEDMLALGMSLVP